MTTQTADNTPGQTPMAFGRPVSHPAKLWRRWLSAAMLLLLPSTTATGSEGPDAIDPAELLDHLRDTHAQAVALMPKPDKPVTPQVYIHELFKMEIHVPGGGIQPSAMPYLFEAPEDGYQPLFTRSHEDPRAPVPAPHFRLYVRHRDGGMHSAIEGRAGAWRDGRLQLNLSWRTNLDGGRLLQPPDATGPPDPMCSSQMPEPMTTLSPNTNMLYIRPSNRAVRGQAARPRAAGATGSDPPS